MNFFVEEGGEEAVGSRNSTSVYQLQQEVRRHCIVNDIDQLCLSYYCLCFLFIYGKLR